MSNNAKKNKSFYLFLIVIPFILLLMLELILNLFSFGQDYPLFIESNTIKGYSQPNPNVIKRFFSNPELAPKIEPDTFYFKKKKPENSFRIVIQGGSTAAGFPFGRFGSIQGMLQQRFKRIYPDKEIEIISTAMSAVNTYTLLDFTEEIIEIKPDLILIYAGHNEYVGIMGVGSAFSLNSSRAATLMFLKLKELKLFQLMQSFVSLFQSDTHTSRPDQTEKRTLMAKAAKSKNIVLNSELFYKGVEQFSLNLDMILNNYKNAGIPVLISTLASNEVDQAPFVSGKDESSANDYFEKAQQLMKQYKYEVAKSAFIEAKDRDLLRFRAPSIFNQIIKEKIDHKLIQLVDTEAAIRSDASNHIIGFQHMFEHLHPNARGYFIMAEAFVSKIIKEKFISKSATRYPKSMAWKDIPLTKVDLIAAAFKIKTLVSDYPFKKNKVAVQFDAINSFENQAALRMLKPYDWFTLHQEMLKHYQQSNSGDKLSNLHEAAKIAGLMFDAFPNRHEIAWGAGQIYFSINDTKIAEYYLKQAVTLQPKNTEYLMNYAYTLYVNKDVLSSMRILERVLIVNPNHTQALKQKKRISLEVNIL